MNLKSNPFFIDLEELARLARGDKDKMQKYLLQFTELIPDRLENLHGALQAEDRTMIRKILHNMRPQLEFFGVPNVSPPIRRLALEYQTIPMPELKQMVNEIIPILEKALGEVREVLATDFK